MDILTRLLLNTDGFDAKLNKSKGNVRSFESSITSMASKAGAGVLKLAGGIGIAIGATEGLERTMRASQATSDLFDNNMNAAKDSVDAFFFAISTGDFSAFENGLFSVFTRARELSAALDDLADKRLAVDLVNLDKTTRMSELEAVIRDNGSTKAQKDAALKEYEQLQKEVAEARLKIANEEFTANSSVELNKIGIKNLTDKDVKQYLRVYNNADYVEPLKKELEYIEKVESAYNEKMDYANQWLSRGNGMDSEYWKRRKEAEAISPERLWKEAFPESEFRSADVVKDFGKLLQQNDKGRAVLYKYETALVNSMAQNAADLRKMTRLGNTASANTGGKKKPGADELQLIAADADYWLQQLMESRGKFDAIAGTLQPVKIPIVLEEEDFEEQLPQSELEIKLKAKLENYNFAKKKIAELKELMEVATTPEEKKQLSGQIDEWAKFGNVFNQDSIKQNNDYAESLQNIGGIMHTLSGITDESTAAWMNWGANTITAISQAIPAIMSLTTANTAKAASEAASSAAQIPFVGWLSAAGAALSVVAAMASIPKCANGGIAYGNSIVNVGEYAGASGNPEVIAPLSKLREYIQPHESNNALGGEVVFTISGTNLKGVLSNYERKHKKFS